MSDASTDSAVPIWPLFVRPVLLVLSDGATRSRRDLIELVLDEVGLSEADRAEALESGTPRAAHRIGWTLSHLTKAGWIDRVSRAHYAITATGRAWLDTNPEGIRDFSTAHRVFHPFWPTKTSTQQPAAPIAPVGVATETETETGVDPLEQIEDGVARIKADIAAELLERLRTSAPAFFEQAVIDVLIAMGYGGAEVRGKHIGGAADGGVDGVIDQDALGLDQIYVQAKRYANGNTVGREAIQAFIGALHGFGASRGVFITSSTFTRGAIEYATNVATRVVLINGTRLAELMIKYRVGVQVQRSYDVVEIDEDFFE